MKCLLFLRDISVSNSTEHDEKLCKDIGGHDIDSSPIKLFLELVQGQDRIRSDKESCSNDEVNGRGVVELLVLPKSGGEHGADGYAVN